MEQTTIVRPEKVDDEYILKVNSWQLDEIKSALKVVQKQRDNANKWLETKREATDTKKKRNRPLKPRLLIGDVISPPSPPKQTATGQEDTTRQKQIVQVAQEILDKVVELQISPSDSPSNSPPKNSKPLLK